MLRADSTSNQTVIVCACGARYADVHAHHAWRLAGRHLQAAHADDRRTRAARDAGAAATRNGRTPK